MAPMNVSLPDPMKAWVEAQTETGRYANASDYVRDLIRKDQERTAKIGAMQTLVDEGLASGEAQAERYKASIDESLRFIEANPLAVRERNEIAPPVRIHRSGVHMIIFTVENDDALVLRVRHGSEDRLNDPVGE